MSGNAKRVSTMPNTERSICFEQPLSERVRTLLRLECLFEQTHHHLEDDTVWGRRATLSALLDILTVLSRSDLKADLIKELKEQLTALGRLAQRPGVDHQRLEQVLGEIEQTLEAMHKVSAQSANSLLRNTEFLSTLMNRSAIPGGTCSFDVPGYQHWLGQSGTLQLEDLHSWFDSIEPFRHAIMLILTLIRNSEEPKDESAAGGVYIHNLTGPCQMLRVLVPSPGSLYPEISAGRHRFTIRFMEQRDGNDHSVPTQHDVDFQLACCAI